MEQKIKYKLRPVRLVFYLLFWAGVVFLYDMFRSYFLWLFLLAATIFPLLSVAGAVYLCGKVTPRLQLERTRAVRAEVVLMELQLQNAGWWISLNSRVQLAVSNTFLEHSAELTAQLPVALHDDTAVKLPFQAVETGRFVICGEFFGIQDVMGFLECQKRISLSKELFVLPRQEAGGRTDITGFLSGAAEKEESAQKGNDFAQVNDVREYVPGDRFRDIHWKLSARQENLMVKERSAMAGSEMVLLLKLTGNTAQAEQILEFAWGLGKNFIEQRFPVCLLCWSQPEFAWEEYRCGTIQELAEAYCGIFGTALSERVNPKAEEHMRNCYPFLKSYLAVGTQDGSIRAQMTEND